MSGEISVDIPDNAQCAAILRERRWKKGLKCVSCLSNSVVKNGVRENGIQQYYCNSCDMSFNDRTGTVFSETRMSLGECFYILDMKEESSINSISGEIGRSWKTVSDFIRSVENSLAMSNIREGISELNDSGLDVDYSKFGCG